MNTLETKIQEDLFSAMKAHDDVKLAALRSIKTAIQNEKVNGVYHELTDNDIISLIQKLSKQRSEASQIYNDAGRDELAQKELNEKTVLDTFLPKMLSEDELSEKIDEIISELGADSIKQMGVVIKTLKERFPNQFDGGVASGIVKSKLSI